MSCVAPRPGSGVSGPKRSGTGTSLVSKAVVACVCEDKMVEQADAEEIGALPESAGAHAILWAGRHIAAGRVIMRAGDVTSR